MLKADRCTADQNAKPEAKDIRIAVRLHLETVKEAPSQV
jgi:hypothetical protein